MATFCKEMLCSSKCNVKKTLHGIWSATCSDIINMTKIPRNMTHHLGELVISKLILEADEISNDLFKYYRSLKKLEIIDIAGLENGSMNFYREAFSGLKELEELKLENIAYDQLVNPDYMWPRNLETLQAHKIGLKQVYNTKWLDELKDLDVSFNKLATLPTLNHKASLSSIILNKNPIDMIEVKQIAPFCQLTAVGMDFGDESKFASEKGCDCFRLYSWLKKDNIQGLDKMKCGIYTSSPSAVQIGYNQCKNASIFTEEESRLRKECLDRSPGSTVVELLLYAVFFSILFPIGYFANEAINRYRSSDDSGQVTRGPPKRKRRPAVKCSRMDSSLGEYDFEEDCSETEQEEE